MASIKRRTQQQQAIWEDFAKYSPATFATVKDGLSNGQNYVVVLGDKISAGATFSDKDPHALASSLQAEMVHSSGIPLPVDSEGRSYDRWNADRARFLADRLGCQMEEL